MRKVGIVPESSANSVTGCSKWLRLGDHVAVIVSAFGAGISAGTLVWMTFFESGKGEFLVLGGLASVLSGFWCKVSHRLCRPPIWALWYAVHSTKLKSVLYGCVLCMVLCICASKLAKHSSLDDERLVIQGVSAALCAINIALTIMGLRGREVLPSWLKSLFKYERLD